MNPSNPAKFGMAFALGLVVALAAVTVYVKSTGLHVQPASAVAAVSQPTTKQPETLNAPKVDKVEEPTPAPAMVAAAKTAEPEATHAPAPQQKVESHPSFRHKAPTPPPAHLVRAHYPNHSYSNSPSAIRVEVSQIHQPSQPSSFQTPSPVAASQPIRVVDEEQAQPIPDPVPIPASAPSQPHVVTLQSGTNISIRLGETVSTDHNFSGDTFRASLDRPIVQDGFIIADKGSKVLGKIAGLDKGNKFSGGANLQLSLVEINTTDGQRVRIQTSFVNRKGPSSDGGEFAKVGGGAVLGALIGGLAGGGKGAVIGAGAGGAVGAGAVAAGKGRPAVIKNEAQLTFQLAAPTTITEHLNN